MVPSKKQRRVIAALWDYDHLTAQANDTFQDPDAARVTATYVQRSAGIIREFLQSSPSWGVDAHKLKKTSAHLDEYM
eukprot:3390973-Lingulodinium_polyedra.AAC.1